MAFSEIEAFPSAVLAHHYPETPNWGDMTKFKEWPDANVDVLVGGTPCQSFSVAGLRKGLDDPRGNLMLTFGAIAAKYRPQWLVWENVPGVLSSNGGRDFGAFLGMLGELGYGFAYRVLDAQYFGVAQRRRRVFVVGHLGDWRRAAAVLFERHSLQGHPAPSREAREGIAPTVGTGAPFSRTGNGSELDALIAPEISNALCARDYKGARPEADQGAPLIAHSLRGEGFDGSEDGTGRGGIGVGAVAIQNATRGKSQNGLGIDDGDVMYTLDQASQHAVAFGVSKGPDLAHCLRAGASRADKHESTTYVAFAQNQRDEVRTMDVAGALGANANATAAIAWSEELTASIDVAGTLQRGGEGGRHDGVMTQCMSVRRLTPVECERLQGFPDNYTRIPYRNKPAEKCPDGPRYKALGNSMAVPVMRWIGERIYVTNCLSENNDSN